MSAQMTIADNMPKALGIFSLRVVNKSGEVVETYEDHNMIVNLARIAMAHLVSEESPSKIITHIGVGTNTESATPQDTQLTNMYSNLIKSHEYPSDGMVKFIWELDYDEANGKAITEFGLICEDGSLFSRKVREPMFKASDLAIFGEWSIIF